MQHVLRRDVVHAAVLVICANATRPTAAGLGRAAARMGHGNRSGRCKDSWVIGADEDDTGHALTLGQVDRETVQADQNVDLGQMILEVMQRFGKKIMWCIKGICQIL